MRSGNQSKHRSLGQVGCFATSVFVGRFGPVQLVASARTPVARRRDPAITARSTNQSCEWRWRLVGYDGVIVPPVL